MSNYLTNLHGLKTANSNADVPNSVDLACLHVLCDMFVHDDSRGLPENESDEGYANKESPLSLREYHKAKWTKQREDNSKRRNDDVS